MEASEMMPRSYVVITPVRNEAAFIGRTIDSMVAQRHQPAQWVIVDDGSTDATAGLVEAAAQQHPWITLVCRPDRGYRQSGGGVVQAFYDGYRALHATDWAFLVKLDGDLSFAPDYFDRCFDHFAEQPSLGVAGGAVCVLDGDAIRIDSPGDPPFHVRGATKIYRRECWTAIEPLVQGPGWDTIDEVRANMRGWQTRTFPDTTLLQHRSTGVNDGTWGNWFKNGLANYITGYHPLFMFAKCARRLFARPRLIAGLALWAGFCSGYLRRQPHVADAESVRYLRKQQLRRLLFQPSIYRPAP